MTAMLLRKCRNRTLCGCNSHVMSLTCTPQNAHGHRDGRANNRRYPMRNVNGAMLLRFHKWSVAAVTVLGGGLAQNALAQSSGTDAIEEDMSEVVVSATRIRNIGIVGEQTAPKSRVTLTGEYLETQTAGNTLFQGLNQLPGVNFANTDPYGSAGGNLRLRSFD